VKGEGMLRVAAAAMIVALTAMLFCLARPSPRAIGAFLGLGLPLAFLGVGLFGLYVGRDLRRRRAL